MENSILILICAAVAVIVILWLVRFILGIKRTNRAYRDSLRKKAEEKTEQKIILPEDTGNTIEDQSETEQKGNENDQN